MISTPEGCSSSSSAALREPDRTRPLPRNNSSSTGVPVFLTTTELRHGLPKLIHDLIEEGPNSMGYVVSERRALATRSKRTFVMIPSLPLRVLTPRPRGFVRANEAYCSSCASPEAVIIQSSSQSPKARPLDSPKLRGSHSVKLWVKERRRTAVRLLRSRECICGLASTGSVPNRRGVFQTGYYLE